MYSIELQSHDYAVMTTGKGVHIDKPGEIPPSIEISDATFTQMLAGYNR